MSAVIRLGYPLFDLRACLLLLSPSIVGFVLVKIGMAELAMFATIGGIPLLLALGRTTIVLGENSIEWRYYGHLGRSVVMPRTNIRRAFRHESRGKDALIIELNEGCLVAGPFEPISWRIVRSDIEQEAAHINAWAQESE